MPLSQDEADKLAQAWGFKDAAEIGILHEQALPGYGEARAQADAEMAALQKNVVDLYETLGFTVTDVMKERRAR